MICQRLEGETIEARNRSKVTPAHSHALQSGAWIEREQTSRGCASMNTAPAELDRYMIFEGVIQWTQAVALQSDRVAAAQVAQFRPGAGRERIACLV